MARPAWSATDTTSPALDAISLATPGPFANGDLVQMNLSASDDSAIATVQVYLVDSVGKHHYLEAVGGASFASVTVDNTWASGQVTVARAIVYDDAGNSSDYEADGTVHYYPDQPIGSHTLNFAALSFTLNNPTADTTPPRLISISLGAPGPFGSGDSIQLNVAASDTSGIKMVEVDFSDSAAHPHVIQAYTGGLPQGGTIDNTWASGQVTVTRVIVYDNAGNSSDYEADGAVHYYPDQPTGSHTLNFAALSFTLNNPTADPTQPTLDAISLATPGPFANGDRVRINLSGSASSGIKMVRIYFYDAEHQVHYVQANGDTAFAEAIVDSTWAGGQVTAFQALVYDNAGNRVEYRADGSILYLSTPQRTGSHALNFGALSFTVNNSAAEETSVALAIPAHASVGAQVTFSVTTTPQASSGQVTLMENGQAIGTGSVTNGLGSVSTTFAAAGGHTVRAVFVPIGNLSPASSPEVTVQVDAAAASTGETLQATVEAGSLAISVASSETVVLPTPTLEQSAELLATSGTLNDVTVTDTRAGAPGFTVSGIVTDFYEGTAPSQNVLNGSNLGWTPEVLDMSTGMTVTPGAAVLAAAGLQPNTVPSDASIGLKSARTLALSAPGSLGTAHLSAALTLLAPTSTRGGTYAATLTLTAI